jgi:hypothetical protein
MSNCTISDVTALIFPPGTRPTAEEEDKIQKAIEKTAQAVSSEASYPELMAAKCANAEAAALTIVSEEAKLTEKPEPKAKVKAAE